MKKTALFLLLVLALAVFFRLFELKSAPPGLYPDEAMNGNNALEALRTAPPAGGFKVFYLENNGREGLFINIQAFFLALLNQNEPWVLRLPSAIFGILTVLGLYFLTKKLFENCKLEIENSYGEKIALLAAFFLAVSFWHINFSRIGFRAIMAPFFLVWAFFFLLKSFKVVRKNKAVLLAGAGGLFFGLGFYSYIAYRPMPLLILTAITLSWFQNKDKANRKKIINLSICFIAVAFLIALPLGIYFLQNPADFFGRTSEISIFNSPSPVKDLGLNILKTAGMFNFVGDWNPRHNIPGEPLLFWPVGILFLIGIAISVFNAFKNHKSEILNPKQTPNPNVLNSKHVSDLSHWDLFRISNLGFRILLAWLLVTALPVVISNEGLPHALRSLLMTPPVFIFAALGGAWTYEKLKAQSSKLEISVKPLRVLTFLFFIWLILNTYHSYFVVWAKNPEVAGAFNQNYVQIGRELNALSQSEPKYVVVEAGGVSVRGIPMPAQTVMFITDTFLPQEQEAKNTHYVLPDQTSQIPPKAFTVKLE